MKTFRYLVVAMLAALPLAAQQRGSASTPSQMLYEAFVVQTIPLRHLTSAEAVKLLSPYVQTAGGGVYEVPRQMHAVTVREVPKIFAQMRALLTEYDRDPVSVILNFQLIAAENTNTRDPAVATLDSLLRGVLKFTGYRLLSTAVASASEGGGITQQLAADGSRLTLNAHVTDIRATTGDTSVHVTVNLIRRATEGTSAGPRHFDEQVLGTGVRVPIGHTVVLGTSAMEGGNKALILTVRPQLAKK